MRYTREHHSACQVVSLHGELYRDDVAAVRRELLLSVVQHRKHLVCDLRDVSRCAPAALAVFPAVARQARNWPGTAVTLCGATPAVSGHLERLGVAQAMPVLASLVAATSAAAACPTGVRPAGSWRLQLPGEPAASAVVAARTHARRACRDLTPETTEVVTFLVNELATQSILLSGTGITVDLSVRERTVRAAVTDEVPLNRHQRATRDFDPLPRLLRELTDRWGRLPTRTGTLAWFLLQDG